MLIFVVGYFLCDGNSTRRREELGEETIWSALFCLAYEGAVPIFSADQLNPECEWGKGHAKTLLALRDSRAPHAKDGKTLSAIEQ